MNSQIKKLLSICCAVLFIFGHNSQSHAIEISQTQTADSVWKNDLKTLLTSNKSVIYALVIRTFNAKDLDNDGLIDKSKGEESGNFINAIDRLDELKKLGINTIHLLPITPVGRSKALGTAGSVYSLADFNSINPEFDMPGNNLNVVDEAKKFIQECHKRNIRVMIDLPACGSIDLLNSHPELFMYDKNGESVLPLNWRDVRLYNVWSDKNNKKLNQHLLDAHKKFIDMCIMLEADGIRADVAALKPPVFWQEIIKYTREKDPQFGFLAESSDFWRSPIHSNAPATQPEQLLKSGFDAYYGSYFRIDEWKNAEKLNEHVLFNLKLTNSYNDKKSVIGSFATHDEKSPVFLGGVPLSKLITVLEATLPALNPYFISGFESGDTYNYPYANKTVNISRTDSNNCFVHEAKLDIFNYSRKPGGNYPEIALFMKKALEFRYQNEDLIIKGKYIPVKINPSKNSQIIAFIRSYEKQNILVLANKDFNKSHKASINLDILNSGKSFQVLVNTNQNVKLEKLSNKLYFDLEPAQAIIFNIISNK